MDQQIRRVVRRITGKDATDIASGCCDQQGRGTLYIGLAGESSKTFRLNPKPSSPARLPPDLVALFGKLDAAISDAVHKGGDAPNEDDSQGFALIKSPPAHALQLELRKYVLAYEAELYPVLETSSDSQHRAWAVEALGYAQRSPRQIAALVRATRDPDDLVRNNSTRAIGVLLRADPAVASSIPVADFVEMAGSGVWTDRNKASSVLDLLTQSRDPKVLSQIEAGAWIPLLEMAHWHEPGHARWPEQILGRIRGIPEERLHQLSMGPPDAFFAAIGVK
jgi:hypothetical protein